MKNWSPLSSGWVSESEFRRPCNSPPCWWIEFAQKKHTTTECRLVSRCTEFGNARFWRLFSMLAWNKDCSQFGVRHRIRQNSSVCGQHRPIIVLLTSAARQHNAEVCSAPPCLILLLVAAAAVFSVHRIFIALSSENSPPNFQVTTIKPTVIK